MLRGHAFWRIYVAESTETYALSSWYKVPDIFVRFETNLDFPRQIFIKVPPVLTCTKSRPVGAALTHAGGCDRSSRYSA